jgi:hypothetical protein
LVDGFLFCQSAKVLKRSAFGDANDDLAIRHGLDLHHENSPKQIFGREIGFAIPHRIELAKFLEVTMHGLKNFGIFLKLLINSPVLLAIL